MSFTTLKAASTHLHRSAGLKDHYVCQVQEQCMYVDVDSWADSSAQALLNNSRRSAAHSSLDSGKPVVEIPADYEVFNLSRLTPLCIGYKYQCRSQVHFVSVESYQVFWMWVAQPCGKHVFPRWCPCHCQDHPWPCFSTDPADLVATWFLQKLPRTQQAHLQGQAAGAADHASIVPSPDSFFPKMMHTTHKVPALC